MTRAFARYGDGLGYEATAGAAASLANCSRHHMATSLVLDIGRGVMRLLLLLVAGRPLLRALRRVTRLAAFGAPVRFDP